MKIHLLNGEPVINEQEKPKYRDFMEIKGHQSVGEHMDWQQALKEWQNNCIPVVNVYYKGMRIVNRKTVNGDSIQIGFCWHLFESGQEVEFFIVNGKATITKII